MHAQLYYTEFYLAQSGKLKDQVAFREMVFEEFHRRGNRLTSEDAIRRLFTRAGVSDEDFNRTWGSFEVNQALRVAQDLARRYGIDSVPDRGHRRAHRSRRNSLALIFGDYF